MWFFFALTISHNIFLALYKKQTSKNNLKKNAEWHLKNHKNILNFWSSGKTDFTSTQNEKGSHLTPLQLYFKKTL